MAKKSDQPGTDITQSFELNVSASLGSYTRRAVDVRESVVQPGMCRFALDKRGHVEYPEVQGGGQGLAAPGNRLPDQDRSFDAE
jgi:hypothetical protein